MWVLVVLLNKEFAAKNCFLCQQSWEEKQCEKRCRGIYETACGECTKNNKDIFAAQRWTKKGEVYRYVCGGGLFLPAHWLISFRKNYYFLRKVVRGDSCRYIVTVENQRWHHGPCKTKSRTLLLITPILVQGRTCLHTSSVFHRKKKRYVRGSNWTHSSEQCEMSLVNQQVASFPQSGVASRIVCWPVTVQFLSQSSEKVKNYNWINSGAEQSITFWQVLLTLSCPLKQSELFANVCLGAIAINVSLPLVFTLVHSCQ